MGIRVRNSRFGRRAAKVAASVRGRPIIGVAADHGTHRKFHNLTAANRMDAEEHTR